jgi:hypothetical protein
MAGFRRHVCTLISFAAFVGSIGSARIASAQADWVGSLEGMAAATCGDRESTGVMLITPATDEPTKSLEAAVKEVLSANTCVELVMDDAPLGDLSGKSDADAIAEGRNYPVDVIVLLRVYTAQTPTAVVRIEHRATQQTQSHRFKPGDTPVWGADAQPVTQPDVKPSTEPDPNVVAATQAANAGRSEASVVRAGAIGVAASSTFVRAESERRRLTLQPHKRSPVVLDPAGEAVPWPHAYELMDQPELATKFRSRRRARHAALAGGMALSGAGAGLLFVAIANQTNCSGGTGSTCARPAFVGAGAGSLGIGIGLIILSALIAPQPIGGPEIQNLVETHNSELGK